MAPHAGKKSRKEYRLTSRAILSQTFWESRLLYIRVLIIGQSLPCVNPSISIATKAGTISLKKSNSLAWFAKSPIGLEGRSKNPLARFSIDQLVTILIDPRNRPRNFLTVDTLSNGSWYKVVR